MTTTTRWSWSARVLTAAGVALVPWIFVLAWGAGTHPVVWIGLDATEAMGLVGTGLLLARSDRRRVAVAPATAVLLAADAWFDVLTAGPGAERTAVLMAACLELPLAALCTAVAWSALRALPAMTVARGKDQGPGATCRCISARWDFAEPRILTSASPAPASRASHIGSRISAAHHGRQ
ncbi:hypothetical protein ACFV8Z_41590 [Streptomyces sp. NPDC059837]|uniref:hypothetical protein n=1 Tax=unclassified Streptomyces TaxID=2593676 RepID=UPI0022550FE2|nr:MULTISPECIES: hypothetical protein [unclassified Streptomyces]MCX4404997.1 hypothetical protein [Streptomyces sp. NBC_01764]MCX5190458.1 hypothetical protein [Streptomyces sp. NBC_00268]